MRKANLDVIWINAFKCGAKLEIMKHLIIVNSIIATTSILLIAYYSIDYVNMQLGNPIVVEVFAQSTQDETNANNETSDMSNNTSSSPSGESSRLNTSESKFVGAGDGIHNAEGLAKIITLEEGSKVLRIENLKVTNGPDLYVYLATDTGSSDFVDLGRLKGNIGNQNYVIPDGTDLTKYNTVLIWCKLFSVLFGSAELAGQN
jgi:hypothetical protein